MNWLPRWPSSLGGRTVLVLLASVILVHLGSMFVYRGTALDAASEADAAQLAGRLATAIRGVGERPPGERDGLAHALSSGNLTLRWDTRPLIEHAPGTDAALRGLASRLVTAMPTLAAPDVRLGYSDVQPPGDAHAILGALRLADGSWLNFSVPAVTGGTPSLHTALVSTSVMAVGVAVVAILLVRTLVSPLRGLAQAADAIGRGPQVAVPEAGPYEVRQVARRFNAMQARIHRLIADRTQALAAVSHDLRTPITRLRLRAGFLADPETQAAIDADLDEMEAMIDATLAYLRGEAEPEQPKPTDLSAMLSTLVDAASDAGRTACFTGPRHAFASVRGLAIKRALANLIENALSYGGAARVALRDTGALLVVTVDDDGPGIPAGELERVFEPFQRLDASRNSRTGGVGLGLAIVRQAALREAGEVRLFNRPEGGLRAELTIPRRGDGTVTCARRFHTLTHTGQTHATVGPHGG